MELKEIFPKIRENEDLSKHCTMRVGGKAKWFLDLETEEDASKLAKYLSENQTKYIVIGEGSNTIFVEDFDGLVIKNCISGIEETRVDGEYVEYTVGAGENWHKFIEFCVDNDLVGNENLAYIPGTIGAAPVQNIAAYGQVQEDTFLKLVGYNTETGEKEEFDGPECEFSYRSSVFKTKYKNKFIITSVTYKLHKVENYKPDFSYHSRYESLEGVLKEVAKEPYTLKDIFNAVVHIRQQKLPQVEEVGTVGSFFINPIISREALEKLQQKFPDIQYYPVDKMQYPALQDLKLQNAEVVKIPIAWIIQELGWRYFDKEKNKWIGKEENNVAISEKHALCIVVKGETTGTNVINFANKIIEDVKTKTDIDIESEVNIIK